MERPKVMLLKFAGTNCDVETAEVLESVGADAEIVVDSQIFSGERKLEEAQALILAGGFSYGDHLGSGRVAATILTTRMGDDMKRFRETKPILGICNGFQILVKSGFLPDGEVGVQTATLDTTKTAKFQGIPIKLKVMDNNRCLYVPDYEEEIEMQNANKEGNFFAPSDVINRLEENGQVVFRYSGENPNGSINDIAGVCDPIGLTLGLMPHSERRRTVLNYPNARRYDTDFQPLGHMLFENMVNHINQGV